MLLKKQLEVMAKVATLKQLFDLGYRTAKMATWPQGHLHIESDQNGRLSVQGEADNKKGRWPESFAEYSEGVDYEPYYHCD